MGGNRPLYGGSACLSEPGGWHLFSLGALAIRAAMTAGVNITYKILINDAVAMTGGQPVEGHLTVAEITHQLRAERVQRIAVSRMT